MRNVHVWVATVVMVVGLGACGDDDPATGTSDVAVETTADSAVETADSAGDTTADVAAETVDTSVVETVDTSVVDTADTSVVDTADTADTSVDTADTSVVDTAETSDSEVVASGCGSPEDCVNCAFPSKVGSVGECYCVFCGSTPMTKAECSANQASWTAFCDPWPNPQQCPQASCLPGAAPLCDAGGQCVADPNSCAFNDSCGTCRFDKPPVTAADCKCPQCGVPLAVSYCEKVEAAVSDVCSGFDYDACPLPPCVFPPPIVCSDATKTCGYGEFAPEER